MNARKFSDAMDQLHPKYVEEALNYEPIAVKHIRHKWMAIAAIIAALILAGFAAAPAIVEMVNGRIVGWDNHHLHSTGNAADMAEVRNGRVYFTLDNSDITEYCSEDTYFRYDFTDSQGIAHIILVGGELYSIGWTEILFLESGKRISHSSISTDDNGSAPAWYIKGNAAVNEDYGYHPPEFEDRHEYDLEVEVVD